MPIPDDCFIVLGANKFGPLWFGFMQSEITVHRKVQR